MSQTYVPNRSYGPLAFGMSPPEAEALLGPSTSFKSPFEGIPLDREMKPFVEGLRVMEFARMRKDHAFPQVMFDGEQAVSFTLFNTGEPFLVSGINLFDKDRGATLVALARLEETYYDNGEYFYLPKNGLQIPNAKLRRKLPYVTFVWDRYEKDRLDFNFLEPSRQLS